ncbi:MAG: ABC-2 family transporter protein, partial [Lachnospiraceae bacterium]|nr:ABC-2 family transporter protein [Lachnospiraceae bacterium]
MRKFLTLTGISIQKLMYYKTSFLLNLITPFIELAGQFLLWNALYGLQGGSPIGGMARREMLTYIPVAFALNNLLSWTTENALSREIRNGTVVARCIRPVSFIC